MRSKDPAEILRFWPRENYLEKSIPVGRDHEITGLIKELRDEAAIERVGNSLTGDTVLGPYIQRMAAYAVHTGDALHIEMGLRAAVVLAVVGDPRDVVVDISLLWRSAELLDRDPAEEFHSVARSVGRYGRPLDLFAAREPDKRTIAVMGYMEVGEGSDFRYKHRPYA